MTDLLTLILAILASQFKSRAELEAEDLVLRQQISVLCRRMPKRPALTNIDRLLFVWLYRWPSTASVLAIVRPETIVRWHRVGCRAYWRWRSRNRAPRPLRPKKSSAPLGRVAEAVDPANVICFLASADADFVTRLTIDVTGGV
jgi:hypothetical protein